MKDNQAKQRKERQIEKSKECVIKRQRGKDKERENNDCKNGRESKKREREKERKKEGGKNRERERKEETAAFKKKDEYPVSCLSSVSLLKLLCQVNLFGFSQIFFGQKAKMRSQILTEDDQTDVK